MRVLILGANGFIGSHLVKKILTVTDWSIYAFDKASDKLTDVMHDERFTFLQGNILKGVDFIEDAIRVSDIILPFIAIATPASYIKDPLGVFELDFEKNLEIIRKAIFYKKRVVFPSTSEVYGMCQDEIFDEDTSNFVLGPICKQRWIYSCCKQLLDRIITAYGVKNELDYTIIRPYNWFGPNLDSIDAKLEGCSRVVTQFIRNVLLKEPIKLVNGGEQKRCFLYIDDGIDCLMKIMLNPINCNKQIFNIGNPDNNVSIRELAHMMKAIFRQSGYDDIVIDDVNSDEFYGNGYQDVSFRIPSIEKAKRLIAWNPKTSLTDGLEKTIKFYIDRVKT